MEHSRKGRPAEGSPIQVRLPDDMIAALDRLAAKRGEPRARVIRAILGAYLDVEVRASR